MFYNKAIFPSSEFIQSNEQPIFKKHTTVLFSFFPTFFMKNSKILNANYLSYQLHIFLPFHIGISLLNESSKVMNY